MKCLVLLCMLTSTAFADFTDALNAKLNPKQENQIGYEVDYREDSNAGWLNITRVIRKCAPETLVIAKGGILIREYDPKACRNMGLMGETGDGYLHQVMCRRLPVKACKARIQKEVTEKVIRQMIDQKTPDVYVGE